jgi:hypothetical protein
MEVADTEARMSVSETKSIDLIAYEGERVLGQSRLELMRLMAEAKVQIADQQKLEQSIEERMEALLTEAGATDKEFSRFRMKEVAKTVAYAGVTGGAIGTLMQEALTVVGVRPQGKDTALEHLWHYLRGNKGGTPVPEDLTQVFHPSPDVAIRIPQGTSLIESATGTSSLIDSNTHQVLATDIVVGSHGDIEGYHIIPGSGVNLESHLTPGSTPSVSEYLQEHRSSYEGSLQEIQRHGHLMNETAKSDLNELKLWYGGENGTGYDSKGNIVIDLKHLTSGGSFQGSRHPDITTLVHEGKIKLAITPDVLHQKEGIVLEGTISANGETVIIPKDASFVATLFGKDGNGRLTHPGFLEAVIADPDGKFTPIATDPDLGRFIPSAGKTHEYIFHRVIGRDWTMPPYIPLFPRKPLEDYRGTGDAKNFGTKFTEPGNEPGVNDFITTDPYKNKDQKFKSRAGVASREQVLPGEENLGKEYPEKQVVFGSREVAEEIIFSRGPILLEDAALMQGKSSDERVIGIQKRVEADREKYEGQENKERFLKILNRAYAGVDEVLSQYGIKGRSPMPDASKVHLTGFYDYFSQAQEHAKTTAGLCFLNSGEIFINMKAVEGMGANNFEENLIHTIAHEVVHDAVANNYWSLETEEGEKVYTSRRSGLLMTKRLGVTSNMQRIQTRGQALNEAVTEELALQITSSLGIKNESITPYYGPERKVLKALQEKFNINFSLFAEAVVNRRKLPELIRSLERSNAGLNKDFVSLLFAIMDYESHRPNCRLNYPQTMALIRGERVNVDSTIFNFLGSKFKDQYGNIKQEVEKKYNLTGWSKKNVAA